MIHYLYSTRPVETVWVLVQGNANCSACGWLTGFNAHYRHAERNEHHCPACHRPGKDWAERSDSEDPYR